MIFRSQRGFSLIEMMVSLVVLMVVSAAAFQALQFYQKSYGSTQVRADTHMGIRSAIELMTQEVGQAGLLDYTTRTATNAVTGSASAQWITVSNADYLFAGEKLTIGTNTTQEDIELTDVNTGTNQIQAVMTLAQAAAAPIKAVGVFSHGVLPSSTSTQLRLFGDINGDNTLVYVAYECDTAAGTLSRSSTTWSSTVTTRTASQILVNNVIGNPGGTACFQYTTATAQGTTFVTSVAVTISIESDRTDPMTGEPATLTKTFLNLSPRNVIAAYNLAQATYTIRLQTLPANIPLAEP